MTLNVNIKGNSSTSTARLLSDFSRTMFSTGIVRHIKMNKRYFARNKSPLRLKQDKIRKLTRSAQLEQDIKDGKVTVNSRGRIIKR
jgi:hypothetical protein